MMLKGRRPDDLVHINCVGILLSNITFASILFTNVVLILFVFGIDLAMHIHTKRIVYVLDNLLINNIMASLMTMRLN